MEPIRLSTPDNVRYIKLGPGNAWADTCLTKGELHFGYRTVPHELCAAAAASGDWSAVEAHLAAEGRKVKDARREIEDFYTLGPDTLWITFADGNLWWAFAESEVTWIGTEIDGSGARVRRTAEGWRKVDIAGEPLKIDALSSKLTQIAAYRQTICRVKPAEYLLRRINAEEEPILVEARKAKAGLIEVANRMIANLHWADFETLVDLIFARSGWQRSSRVGETQADVDLILEQPTTGETAFVQVKSKAGQSVLDDYVDRFRRAGTFDRFFFICHSPTTALAANDRDLHVWTGDRLADVAVKNGLFDWIAERSA